MTTEQTHNYIAVTCKQSLGLSHNEACREIGCCQGCYRTEEEMNYCVDCYDSIMRSNYDAQS